MSQQETIKLTEYDTVLIGKYSQDCTVVTVELTGDMGYTVYLPDLTTAKYVVIQFKNLSDYDIVISTVQGQIIDYVETYTKTIHAKGYYSVISNTYDKWIALEDDSGIYDLPATFGDSTNGVSLGTDGNVVLKGTAKSWRDELGDILKVQVVGVGVSINATENSAEFTTLANLSDYLYSNYQLNHDKYIGGGVYFHIHFWQDNNAIPNFLFRYRWQVNGQAKTTAWTDLICKTPVFTYVSGTLNQIAYAAAITPPANASLSDIIQIRVFRDNANTSTKFAGADPYTGTVGISFIDAHFEVDGFGSNTEYAK